MIKTLKIEDLRIDGGTQSRVELNEVVVSDYAGVLLSGNELPPVIVFFDGSAYWLADGFHRMSAYRHAKRAALPAEVVNGTRREAILHSVGANDEHGLRRSNADKRKAVETLLADAEWATWSDSAIAKQCRVDHKTVAKIRAEHLGNSQDSRTVTRGGKTYQQNTANIGAKPKVAPKESAPEANDDEDFDPEAHEVEELKDAVRTLAEENDLLRDQIAVGSMDLPEEEKQEAAEVIASLRQRIKALETELAAVKSSRDSYQAEAAEMKRQLKAQRRELDKMRAA